MSVFSVYFPELHSVFLVISYLQFSVNVDVFSVVSWLVSVSVTLPLIHCFHGPHPLVYMHGMGLFTGHLELKMKL